MTPPRIIASLDLACLMKRLLTRRPRLTAKECDEINRLFTRALAALTDDPLPPGETVNDEVAKSALASVLKALTAQGFTNAQLVSWFNSTAIERTH